MQDKAIKERKKVKKEVMQRDSGRASQPRDQVRSVGRLAIPFQQCVR